MTVSAGPVPAVPALLSSLVDHRSCHDDVLVPLAPAAPAEADAVVVPTSRGSGGSGLHLAASIALAHGCPLVVLASADAASPDGRKHVEEIVREATGGSLTPTHVPLHGSTSPLAFTTDASELARWTWSGWPGPGDTALKRNLALLLARREGWSRLLFLDDDIVGAPADDAEPLDAEAAGLAMGALAAGAHAGVGWAAVEDETRGYADNSVVCRIRRHVGFPQEVFIGGGALAVRVDAGVPHFPRIYNEDWLFCLGLLLREGRGSLALAGHVSQDQPEVIFNPGRALMEEPGDILAEALMNSASDPAQLAVAGTDEAFWRAAVLRRVQLVHDIRPLLHEAVWKGRVRSELGAAREALDATAALHERMVRDLDAWSRALRDFVRAWREDSGRWTELLGAAELHDLPPELSQLLPRSEDLHIP